MVYRSTAKDVSSWIEIRRVAVSGMDVGEKLRFLKLEDPETEVVRQSLELDVTLDTRRVCSQPWQQAVSVGGVSWPFTLLRLSDRCGIKASRWSWRLRTRL